MGLITVGRFTSPWNAHLARGRLEAEGVLAYVIHEYHVSIDWPYSQALGGVKEQVHPSNKDQAINIISSHLKGEYSKDLNNEDFEVEMNVCPHCGSSDYSSHLPKLLILLNFATLLFHIIFPIRAKNHICIECSKKWIY